jgi:hypothetical protein
MGYRKHGSTAIAGLVLASLVAPMAHAESGPWIRYKQGYPSPVQTRVYHRGGNGGWDRRTYNNRYGDNNRDSNRHDNRGGRGRGRWSDQQGRDDD